MIVDGIRRRAVPRFRFPLPVAVFTGVSTIFLQLVAVRLLPFFKGVLDFASIGIMLTGFFYVLIALIRGD